MIPTVRIPRIPPAQQAQIIRANQRDVMYVSSLREQIEAVVRSWLGSRRLSRWEKEIDLLAKLVYYGFVLKAASQTLGEEYTNIWQYARTTRSFPSTSKRIALVLLPALPAYVLSRYASHLSPSNRIAETLKRIPPVLDVISEINLAVFYFNGVYYTLVKRLLGVRHITSIPENPNVRPPSYSLLGVLICIRLITRLVRAIRAFREQRLDTKKSTPGESSSSDEPTIDGASISRWLSTVPDDSAPPVLAEDDAYTALDIPSISNEIRERRNCTLCLEERTSTCATECGHLYCWTCIFGWGREKAECPLCRQALNLTKLIPIYNL